MQCKVSSSSSIRALWKFFKNKIINTVPYLSVDERATGDSSPHAHEPRDSVAVMDHRDVAQLGQDHPSDVEQSLVSGCRRHILADSEVVDDPTEKNRLGHDEDEKIGYLDDGQPNVLPEEHPHQGLSETCFRVLW